MKKHLRVLTALLLAIAGPVLAGNGVNTLTATFETNVHSIAVNATVTGDNDTNAVLRIFQRDFGLGGAYDTGQVMVRRIGFGPSGNCVSGPNRECGSIYMGRIFPNSIGQLVQFYVEANDPTSGITTTTPTVASCETKREIDATGPQFYVDARLGNDNNDGTESRPKRTINAALDALGLSTNHGRHGGVWLRQGEYHEQFAFDSSRFPVDDGPWFVAGDGTNPDSTIICGANPWLELGMWAPGKPLKWVYTGQDSTWKTYLPGSLAGSSPGDSLTLLVLGFGELIHRKTSIKAILDDSTYAYTFASPGGIGSGELSGYWWQSDTLYVKRRNGKSPSGMPVHAGYLDALAAIRRQNVNIEHLTFRYAGGPYFQSADGVVHAAAVSPIVNGFGVVGGAGGTATNIVVNDCRFYGFNEAAIFLVKGAGGFVCDHAIVCGNTLDNLRTGDFNYGACKSRVDEGAGQMIVRGRRCSIYSNVIRNGFNGLGIDSFAADSGAGMNNEIVGNRFEKLTDDAMELDTGHQLNMVVMNDTTIDTNTGISICALLDGGPVFVYNNLFLQYRAFAVKGCGGNVGIVQFVHNTMGSTVVGTLPVNYAPGGTVDQTSYTNNLMTCNGCFALIIGPSSGGSTTNSFNWNEIHGTGTTTFLQWNGTNYTFAQAQSVFGWEKNGLNSAAALVDTTRGNWSLGPTSPALNSGRRWTGLNTMIGGVRYYGAAPDRGAIERVQP